MMCMTLAMHSNTYQFYLTLVMGPGILDDCMCGMLLFFRNDNHSDGSSNTADVLKCAHVISLCVDICLFFVSSIDTI